MLRKVNIEEEAASDSTFCVALEIVRHGKSFTNGEMVKECVVEEAEEMCPNVNLFKTALSVNYSFSVWSVTSKRLAWSSLQRKNVKVCNHVIK